MFQREIVDTKRAICKYILYVKSLNVKLDIYVEIGIFTSTILR